MNRPLTLPSVLRDAALGLALGALPLLLPLPHSLRSAFPLFFLLLLAPARLRAALRFKFACAPLFLGLGVGPLLVCADLRAGTALDWIIAVTTLLLGTWSVFQARPPARPQTESPAPGSPLLFLYALAGGAAGALLTAAAALLLAPFAGAGAPVTASVIVSEKSS